IEDPESAPTTIDRPRARVGTVTLAAERTGEDPRWGSTTASTVAYAKPSPGPSAGDRGLDAATAQIVEAAEAVAARASEAAEGARVASRAAGGAAIRADRAAEAAKRVREAARALDEGQPERARELLRLAGELLERG